MFYNYIVPYNESAIENHITKEHSDIENEYQERNIPDSWPWKYQTKLRLAFLVKCNHCGECVRFELSTDLKKHYEENHKEIWEKMFKQGEAHDQPGPSAGPCQPRKETLQAKFEKHSWMKGYFKQLPDRKFRVKCLVENCKEVLVYVTIQKFMDHMKTEHIKIHDFESKKKESNDPHWAFFMQNKQGEIECLICTEIVTDKSTGNHIIKHISNNPKGFYNTHGKYFANLQWAWKYMEQAEDFLAKCKLCEISDIKVWFSASLKRHCEMHLMQESEAIENILKQREAHDQAGPSTQPLENITDKTLKSEFEKHSWLKNCYENQSDLFFGVKCLIKTCQDRFPYVDITKFAEHMQTNHIKICDLEEKKCSPSNLDINWIYFMHKEQGEIECLICRTIVTDKSTDNHVQNHMSKDSLYFTNCNNINRFKNIKKNWVWKYQKRIGEYIVKCILCKEDSPKIHLTTNTTNLQNHYKKKHIDKWNKIIKKNLKPEEMQEQAGPSRKLKKTS